MNQLQKDIKVALSWFPYVPYGECYKEDSEAFKRLEQYMMEDLNDSTNSKNDNMEDLND